MELCTTTDFTLAVKAYINTLLKGDDVLFQEMVDFLASRQARIDAMKNDRGVSTNGEFKHTLSMPEKLGYLVLQKFPEITKNKKNLYKFMRAFPQFCASSEPFKTKYV